MRYQQLHEEYLQRTPADLTPDRSAPIEDRLAELGLNDEQIAGALELIDEDGDRIGYHRAAVVLREIFRRLGSESSAGAALAHVVSQHNEKSLAQLAAELPPIRGKRRSKQACGNQVPEIRRALAGLVDGNAVGTDARSTSP